MSDTASGDLRRVVGFWGGTALIVNCVQIGLLQNVALRRREY